MKFNTKHAIGRSAALVGFFGLIADIAGLLRDRLFAATFGAGHVLDSYYAAFRIPDFVYNLLILGTLSVAFIPVFTEHLVGDEEDAKNIANTVLTVSTLVLAVMCGILYFFVPQLIHHVIAPGFSGQTFNDTVTLTKIFLLSPIIFTASSVFGSVLNSLNRFLMVSIAPVLYNLGIMFGAVFLYPRFGIAGLAYGVIIGALAHLLTQIIGAAVAGFHFKPKLAVHNPGVKRIFQLLLPRIIGVDNSLVSLMIASYFGSFLASGSIAIFSFANNLEMVPMGIFALAFATAAFPNLSQHFAKHDETGFNDTLSKTSVNILYFMIPSSALLIVLRAQIVRVIYGTGQFNWNATRLTANSLGLFAIGLFAQAITPLMSRAFYARQNTIIPVVAGLIAIVANAALSYFLIKPFGVAGLALGFSLSTILNAVILYIALKPRLHEFSIKQPLIDSGKIILASLILAVVSYFCLYLVQLAIPLTRTLYVLAQGSFAAVAGLLIYFLCTKWLGLNQSALAVNLVKRRFIRK